VNLRNPLESFFMTLAGVSMRSRNYLGFGYKLAFIGLILAIGNNFSSISTVVNFHKKEIGDCITGKGCLYIRFLQQAEAQDKRNKLIQEEALRRDRGRQ
jgi:hypothetical protein